MHRAALGPAPRALVLGAVLCAALVAQAGAARAGPPSFGAATPIAVSLNASGFAATLAVSCIGPGTCTDVGRYQSANGNHAFAVSQLAGRFARPEELGRNLNSRGDVQLNAVSCTGPGACSAVGLYTDRAANLQPFAVTETRGHWGAAVTLLGVTRGGTHGNASAVSCASPGNCLAVGENGRVQHTAAFAARQVGGIWSRAVELAATLNRTGGAATADAMSCPTITTCVVAGTYHLGTKLEDYVQSEVDGRWGAAREVAGALNAGDAAFVGGVSCATAGYCTMAGTYTDATASTHPFIDVESAGRWGPAVQVAGNLQGSAIKGTADAVACPARGTCAIVGWYRGASEHAFGLTEEGGHPGAAVELAAGLDVLGAYAGVVTCASPGRCVAGGTYSDTRGALHAFSDDLEGATWAAAIPLPSASAANNPIEVDGVACTSGHACTAVGTEGTGSPLQAFAAWRGGVLVTRVAGLHAVVRGHALSAVVGGLAYGAVVRIAERLAGRLYRTVAVRAAGPSVSVRLSFALPGTWRLTVTDSVAECTAAPVHATVRVT